MLQASLLALANGYLLALLLAARGLRSDRQRLASEHDPPRTHFTILVPAHDEAEGIETTLRALARIEYPTHLSRTIVIADNCTDTTAERARDAGFEVWTRTEPDKRGKGFALAWGLDRLIGGEQLVDALVVVDADCLASPNILAAFDRAIGEGASAVQASNVVENAQFGTGAALRSAAFTLMNLVRPMGKERVGLSAGLLGTGMAFTRELIVGLPWASASLAEDAEYHLRLVEAGHRVAFAPEASVSSAMPTTLEQSTEQQERWEKGRLALAGDGLRLARQGLVRRDPIRLHAGLETLIPPQSLLAAAGVANVVTALALRSRRLLTLSGLSMLAQVAFVLGGLRLAEAPAHTYRALMSAPAAIAHKLRLFARLLRGDGPSSWIRTERDASGADR